MRSECLARSLLFWEGWGVWGGLPPRARESLLEYLLEGLMSWDRVVESFQREAERRSTPLEHLC